MSDSFTGSVILCGAAYPCTSGYWHASAIPARTSAASRTSGFSDTVAASMPSGMPFAALAATHSSTAPASPTAARRIMIRLRPPWDGSLSSPAFSFSLIVPKRSKFSLLSRHHLPQRQGSLHLRRQYCLPRIPGSLRFRNPPHPDPRPVW